MPNMEKLEVNRLRYKVKEISQIYQINPNNIDVQEIDINKMLSEEICLKASYKVYGRDVDEIRFPSNWREAFKARWFPGWLKKRFPIEFNIIKIEALLPLREVEGESLVMQVIKDGV